MRTNYTRNKGNKQVKASKEGLSSSRQDFSFIEAKGSVSFVI